MTMLLDSLKKMLSSEEFLPHIHCYLDNGSLVRLHLVSDLLIALAYYSIPLILFYFIRKKRDLPFKGVFYMFAAFIFACGTTHLLEVWTLWHPAYWVSGWVKSWTAFLSISTALILIPLTPKALSLRSHQELEDANLRLEAEILQRKKAEEAIQKAQAELEKRVEERTLELSLANRELKREIEERQRVEEALQLKSEELKRSNKELEQFAYIASHDLQEPLYIIAGFADTIKEQSAENMDPTTLFLLDRIQNAASRMRQLIADLLQFARVNTQAKPFEEVDLNGVLREILLDFDLKIKETNAKIEVGPLPTLHADRMQMRQLFQNLIGNAIKFRKKDRDLIIKIHASEGEWGKLQILVEDNGIGFEDEFADKILQPFQRLNKPGEYEGSGLGLAICQKIVFRHRGHIQAKGRPQLGAAFTVFLPSG